MDSSKPKKAYAAPALDKAFEVIELLANYPDGALISEMAADRGRSVGELFRIVVVMERLGYLQRSTKTDRYSVSYKFLDLALRATPAQNLIGVALPEMRLLAAEIGQSCHLVVPNGGHGLVIAREENPGVRAFALKVGAAIELLRSCSGHVILAFQDPASRERTLEAALRGRDTPPDLKELSAQLQAIGARGFDRRASPITHGVTDVSFPVFGFSRQVVGALTIPFLELIDGSQKVDLATATEALRAAAARVSAGLGYAEVGAN